MELKKISIKELYEFISSEWFLKLNDKPVSPLRVASYLKNPHALPNDPVLYFLMEEDRIVAYRTVFPARLTLDEERFAWLSGNWVHPDSRRKGYSEKLLNEILQDWNSRLLFTNYAPASLSLYLKTNLFTPVYSGIGKRFYLFAKTKKLFSRRFQKLSFIWPFVDFLIGLLASFRLAFFRLKTDSEFTFQTMRLPDEECYQLAELQKPDYLFLRGKEELQWIVDFPWISTSDQSYVERYAFSSFADRFEYRTVKVFRGGVFLGFLLYSIRDGHLKTLHSHFTSDCIGAVAGFLSQQAVRERIEFVTVLNSDLSEAVVNQLNPFLFVKEIDHRIYSSFPIMPENRKIQDGDGDFIFS